MTSFQGRLNKVKALYGNCTTASLMRSSAERGEAGPCSWAKGAEHMIGSRGFFLVV